MTENEQPLLHTDAVTISHQDMDRILAKPLLARIATTGKDMKPHVVPVWYYWDGAFLYMETGVGFRKARNLQENPNCSITIDDTLGGLRFWGIFMQGEAELITEPVDWVQEMVVRIYRRYLGAEGILAPTPQRMIKSEHVIIKFRPQKLMTWNDTEQAITPIG